MFAISFDMDTTVLQASYHNPSWQNAYGDIGRILYQYGFKPSCTGHELPSSWPAKAGHPRLPSLDERRESSAFAEDDGSGILTTSYGVTRQQGSVYFGDDTVDAVRCVLATQALSRNYVWFKAAVRDIRMLRIEDNNDLMPAVNSPS